MTDHAQHDLDELSESLDGRLPAERREALAKRVASCPECRAAQEAMAWARTQAGRSRVAVPPEFQTQLRRAIDREIERTRLLTRRVGLGLAAVVVLGLTVLLTRAPSRSPSLPDAVAADFRAWRAGRLAPSLESGDPARLEAHFAEGGLTFRTRVFDLAMMGYVLRGGRVHAVAGRPSALFAYAQTPTGREVICQMLEESLIALPPPEDERESGGIPFRVYAVEDVTLVFWQEGNVLCVLAGDADPESIVQLAFAKAERALIG